MSRRAGMGAMLAAVGALLVAAPGAAAEQYELVASDGTTCTLEKTHGSELEPDGEWTISWGAGITCDEVMGGVDVRSELWRWTPSSGPVTYSPNTTGYCTYPAEPWTRRPCGSWTVRSDGIAYDLPGADYEHHTTFSISLPPTGAPVQPVWVVTPVAAGCLPGGQTTGCTVVEELKPE